MKPPKVYLLRCQIFAFDCIEYFEKLRFLFGSARRRLYIRLLRCLGNLLCILLIIVEHLDLCLDVFRQRFRWCFHKRVNFELSDTQNQKSSSGENK